MNHAFIFDLDGVLIDDEKIWEEEKNRLFTSVFGLEVYKKMGSTLGVNIDYIYDMAIKAGANVEKQTYLDRFYEIADAIYKNAPISEGANELAELLKEYGYLIAIVSASPLSWITSVTKRMKFEDDIELIISLHDRDDLMHKPAPDGYNEAIRILGASPETTIILEDSNSGIMSAKTSGAYTIGLKQNVVAGYRQSGADEYVLTMKEVEKIIKYRKKLGNLGNSQ